jgi:hypothetical protein
MSSILLGFGSAFAVLWLFTIYEIAFHPESRHAFSGERLIWRVCTPICVTYTVAVFAEVILLRT